MELLCPNCQQRVTVPDQYAGQVMKCPLCSNTFTTPSLASASGPVFVPPAAPAPSVGNTPAAVEPFTSLSSPAARAEPAPVMPTAVPEPVSGDYRHRLRLWFSPRVLPWIAVVALVIVFILTFFSWVGYYPGGIGVATQNAWQAAFGSYSHDPDLVKIPPLSKAEGKDQVQPGANGLLIVFVLLFPIVLLAALVAAALGILARPLPPAVERLKPWRWAIVSGITLLAFLFLVFQLLSGFSLATQIRDRVTTIGAERSKAAPADHPTDKKEAETETALHASAVRTTCSFKASFWLTLLAVICAALTNSLSRRTSRPLPRIELMW